MSCPSRLEEFEHYIRKRFVEDGVSQLQVSDEMKALLPECIGFSAAQHQDIDPQNIQTLKRCSTTGSNVRSFTGKAIPNVIIVSRPPPASL